MPFYVAPVCSNVGILGSLHLIDNILHYKASEKPTNYICQMQKYLAVFKAVIVSNIAPYIWRFIWHITDYRLHDENF